MTRDNMKQYIKCMLDLEKTMYTYGRSLSKLENQIKRLGLQKNIEPPKSMSYSGFEFGFIEFFVETCKKAVWGAGGGAVVGGIVGSIMLYVTRDIFFAIFYKTFWIYVGIGILIGIIIGIVIASSQYIHEKNASTQV